MGIPQDLKSHTRRGNCQMYKNYKLFFSAKDKGLSSWEVSFLNSASNHLRLKSRSRATRYWILGISNTGELRYDPQKNKFFLWTVSSLHLRFYLFKSTSRNMCSSSESREGFVNLMNIFEVASLSFVIVCWGRYLKTLFAIFAFNTVK